MVAHFVHSIHIVTYNRNRCCRNHCRHGARCPCCVFLWLCTAKQRATCVSQGHATHRGSLRVAVLGSLAASSSSRSPSSWQGNRRSFGRWTQAVGPSCRPYSPAAFSTARTRIKDRQCRVKHDSMSCLAAVIALKWQKQCLFCSSGRSRCTEAGVRLDCTCAHPAQLS